MKLLLNIVLFFSVWLINSPGAYAMMFAPFQPCKTAGADLYVKKFKDTKPNEINFIPTEEGCEVEIVSDNSGSMLVRRVSLESAKYKTISFDVKVTALIEGADLTEKKGDDASARLYVFFEYEPDKAGLLEKAYRKYSGNTSDGKAIVYVWGTKESVGDVIENPYSDQFMQIVVESGAKNLGKYVTVKRNVFNDFKANFGYEPPKNISSIAIMTDTDNTGGKATGYFKRVYLDTK